MLTVGVFNRLQMLSKLQQYAVQNEASLFPPLGSIAVARQEAQSGMLPNRSCWSGTPTGTR